MRVYEDTGGGGLFAAFDEDHIAGCLLGGALGDALGLPVQGMYRAQIEKKFGERGITRPPIVRGLTKVSDSTQLAIFTAEGVLRAIVCDERRGEINPVEVLHRAYLRWFYTQELTIPAPWTTMTVDGWLGAQPRLFARRNPSTVALSALGSGIMGSVGQPINWSNDSAAVVRVAPIGLVESIVEPFALGADAAALTHGHPCAYLSAGVLSAIVQFLAKGKSLEDAVAGSIWLIQPYEGHEPVRCLLEQAICLAKFGEPSCAAIESIGSGWTAEESLAIGLYCALAHQDDFAAGVCLAANHSGNSSATAAITGNLLGTALGRDAIPAAWLAPLELREQLEQMATDLVTGFSEEDEWFERYPEW